MWGFQFFLVFLVAGVVFVTGQTLDEDLTLTHSEKLTLDKVRNQISANFGVDRLDFFAMN